MRALSHPDTESVRVDHGAEGKVYFDLTSALRYIIENDNITGIQRVEINIALGMATYLSNVHICYFDEELRKHKSCPIAHLTQGQPFSKELILSKLGALESGIFPRPRTLKAVLNKSRRKGFSRSLFKIYLYVLAVFSRERYYSYFPRTTVELDTVDNFSEKDVIYLIGNMITTPELINTAIELKHRGGTVVQTVHDVIPLTRPELVPTELTERFTRWIKVIPSYATHLICVSEYTKTQVEKLFNKNIFESISAIPLAHEFLGEPRVTEISSSLRDRPPANELFVLCVGTIEVRKNGFNLLQAWKKVMLALGDKTPKLVFAGKIGWHLESFEKLLASDSSLKSAIEIITKPTE